MSNLIINNSITFIFNVSIAVFVGGLALSLTNDAIKHAIKITLPILWKRVVRWRVMRDPPKVEVVSISDATEQPSDKLYLNLNHFLTTQPTLPGTNLYLGLRIAGRNKFYVKGKKINVHMAMEDDLLSLGHMDNIIPGPMKLIRMFNEVPYSGDYALITSRFTISPKKPFKLRKFTFYYVVVGTNISGSSTLMISTASEHE